MEHPIVRIARRLLAGTMLVGSIGLLVGPPGAAPTAEAQAPESATAVTATSAGPYCAAARDQADRALAQIQVPQPRFWAIEWHCGSPGWGARTNLPTRTINVWVETRSSVRDLEWTFVHELGHVYDFEMLDDDDRYAWRQVRGLTEERAWWANATSLEDLTHEEWIADPAEDFAEAFAWCWLGDDPAPSSQQITPPSAAQCDLVAGLTGVPVPAQ